MKKLFLSLALVFACVASVLAQTSDYEQVFLQMMQVGGVSAADNLRTDNIRGSFTKILVSEGLSEKKAQKKVDKYLQEQALYDLAHVLAPYFEESVSLEAMNECLTSLQDPEFRQIYAKMNSTSKVVSEKTSAIVEDNIVDFMMGIQPAPVQLDKRVNDTFLQLIQEYNSANNATETFKSMVEPLKGLLSSSEMSEEDQNVLNKTFDTMLTYLADNTNALTANALVGAVSADEMKLYIDKIKQPAWQEYITGSAQAATAIVRDAMNMGLRLIASFQVWAKHI